MKLAVKNLVIVAVIAVLGIVLVASFFMPVISPSQRYEDTSTSFSCKDIVIASRGDKDFANMSNEEKEAFNAISDTKSKSLQEQKAGRIVRILGTIGLSNCFVGAIIILCSILWLFMTQNMMRLSLVIFSAVGIILSISAIVLICVYLGLPTVGAKYSYFRSISAGSFVALGVSLCAITLAMFLESNQSQE